MLSASYNQGTNPAMNDYTNIMSFDNFSQKSDMYHYISEHNKISMQEKINMAGDTMFLHSSSNNNIYQPDFHYDQNFNNDVDFNQLSGRFTSMNIKNNMSRANSAHNSPFDNRVTPRHCFSQSTSNTPAPGRLNREMDMMRNGAPPPVIQLFNNSNAPGVGNSTGQLSGNNGRQSPMELIEYQSMASKMGFLVGQDLEDVLNRSASMKNSNSSRITNFFKHKHGSSGTHSTQKQYLVLGVRVPSKEHVSEIVGKEGKKIKAIRLSTGALIATPNEKEDHVFLIESLPETAIRVGKMIQQFAETITRNKLGNNVSTDRPRSPAILGSRVPLATSSIGVPQRLVGKVIGTQGSIITTVQKETGTEIKSPPKDEMRAPDDNADFEISVYENGTVNSEDTAQMQIHRAKQLIAHLVMRVWEQQPRNSSPSSDEGANVSTYVSGSGGPEWIWPTVVRMDDGDAKEIIDRILRSSKAKITSSTSSTEGTSGGFDSLLMSTGTSAPTGSGMSPTFGMNHLIEPSKKSPSEFNMPYKMFSSEDDPWSRRVAENNGHHNSTFYPNSYYPSGNGDCAFYETSTHYYNTRDPQNYMPEEQHHNGYEHIQHHQQQPQHHVDINDNQSSTSWANVNIASYGNNSNVTNSINPYPDQVKQLWKSPNSLPHDSSSNCSIAPPTSSSNAASLWMSSVNWAGSTFGAVGDRRNYSDINEETNKYEDL